MTRATSRPWRLGLMAMALVLAGSACATSPGEPTECTDSIDNDGDGKVDAEDPACIRGGPDETPDPYIAKCNDGRDNDQDGVADFPADRGCSSLDDDDEFDDHVPQCRDGIDNDGDGKKDYPNDPGCSIDLQDSELDTCPGEGCPACGNGIDDDGDGKIDYPDDNGCDTAADDLETATDPGDCGAHVVPQPLPVDGVATGTAAAQGPSDLISNGCAGSGQESVFSVDILRKTTLRLSTDFSETTFDTVVYLRNSCRGYDDELGCNDDGGGVRPTSSIMQLEVQPGTYYIVVDAHDPGAAGNFKLQVDQFISPGEPCDTEGGATCSPGYVCRLLDPSATEPTCELPACKDGIDSDGDGIIDYPDEPGCTSPDDPDESDSCPTGPGCPQCGNGTDDDADGIIDYAGHDPGCSYAADDLELDECVPGLIFSALTGQTVSGTTTGNGLVTSQCGADGPEDAYQLDLDLALSSLTFTTRGSPDNGTVLQVYKGTCGTTQGLLQCQDGFPFDVVTVGPADPGAYYAVVDGWSPLSYQLSVSGTIAGGDPCDAARPWFACEHGFVCDSQLCVPTVCNDDLDNDGDGNADYPVDPGCISVDDDTEEDDCPDGPGCPQCSNTLDDDTDGQIDYPADDGCSSAGDDVEAQCIPGLELAVLPPTPGGVTGTTSGTGVFSTFCGGWDIGEAAYVFPVDRQLLSVSFSTEGSTFDTLIDVFFGVCGDSSSMINCIDGQPNETFTVSAPAQGNYYVIVDSWQMTGTYTLSVSGVIPGGQACDPALPNFVCEEGFACDGTTCAPAACNDDVDNDGDGKADYPLDPGCSSISDADESDSCPNGPGCPACSNGLDDDGDGFIDYGPDLGCAAAGDNDESDCTGETDPLVLLTQGTVTGDTTGASDTFAPSCSAWGNSPDEVFILPVPSALLSLHIDTEGSVLDTVVVVKTPDCAAADLACNDEGNVIFGASLIELSDVPIGSYRIIVDGYGGGAGPYQLHVKGTIRAGGECDPATIATGLFQCESGYACGGGVCVTAQCNDDGDNDGDGAIDYPSDPGCSSISDNDEADNCPGGAGCPACGNGVDDDGDGAIDYPSDPGCNAAGDNDEVDTCIPGLPFVTLTTGTVSGTTTGNGLIYSTCGGGGGENAYLLDLDLQLTSLSVATTGGTLDAVLDIYRGTCGAPASLVTCADSWPTETAVLTSPTPGGYYIVVDGWGAGSYTISVSGTIATGQACDAARPWFACTGGATCANSICQ